MGHHIVEIMYGDDTTSQQLVAPIPARWESGAGNAMGSSNRRRWWPFWSVFRVGKVY